MLVSASRSAAVAGSRQFVARRYASTGITHKYATALYSAALAKSPATLTKVDTELTAIQQALKSKPELHAFISDPTISARDRISGLPALFEAAEGTGAKKTPISDVTKNLFQVLSENGRLGETEGVIVGFAQLFAKYKGELEVTVTSATPLAKDVLTKLEATLKQSQAAQQAKTLKIKNKVNPDILGGLLVDFGDKTIDLSVSSRVNKLNNVLQQSV